MKRSFFAVFSALFMGMGLLTGCADKANVAEVLQQPQDAVVRTRYHLWYTDPAHVTSLNYMGPESKFIPAGSVIQPLEVKRGTYNFFGHFTAVDSTIRFTDEAGQEFTVYYDNNQHMMPVEDFLRQFLTCDSAESVYAKVPADELERVRGGKLEKGMHRESLLVLLGPPARSRTSSLDNQSYLYWDADGSPFRVIFRGSKIRHIGSMWD